MQPNTPRLQVKNCHVTSSWCWPKNTTILIISTFPRYTFCFHEALLRLIHFFPETEVPRIDRIFLPLRSIIFRIWITVIRIRIPCCITFDLAPAASQKSFSKYPHIVKKAARFPAPANNISYWQDIIGGRKWSRRKISFPECHSAKYQHTPPISDDTKFPSPARTILSQDWAWSSFIKVADRKNLRTKDAKSRLAKKNDIKIYKTFWDTPHCATYLCPHLGEVSRSNTAKVQAPEIVTVIYT